LRGDLLVRSPLCELVEQSEWFLIGHVHLGDRSCGGDD
jgi:hypothetical protein